MDEHLKKTVPVPKSRFARLSKMGALAGRVAGNILVDSGKDIVKGRKPAIKGLLLTEKNLTHLADQLATMRGAAMKVGQLISMDAGSLLPKELSIVLDRLRSHAFTMPAVQLHDVLESNWGEGWVDQFEHFSFDPIAAASIGQVHRARSKDGRELALKIQYPGVRESINSDLDNVFSLLRLSGLVPKDLDVTPLFDEARTQLMFETDYLREGQQLVAAQKMLSGFARKDELAIPEYYSDLSTAELLCMSYMSGFTLDQLESASQSERNRVVSLLFELFFYEFFDQKSVQTDPNLANYLFNSETGQVVLLDFGATRAFPDLFVQDYKQALYAAFRQDRKDLEHYLKAIGFFSADKVVSNLELILDIFSIATEPMRYEGAYDFSNSDLAMKIRAKTIDVSSKPDAWHTPPPDILFLHRKMAGLFLMAQRLGAAVDVNGIVRNYFYKL